MYRIYVQEPNTRKWLSRVIKGRDHALRVVRDFNKWGYRVRMEVVR